MARAIQRRFYTLPGGRLAPEWVAGNLPEWVAGIDQNRRPEWAGIRIGGPEAVHSACC